MAAYRRARAAGQFADQPFGDVFLVIDGWLTMRDEYDSLEQRLQEVASRGLTYGIHLVISAGRWSETSRKVTLACASAGMIVLCPGPV